MLFFFFFQAEDGIRDAQESRGLGDVYKRQASDYATEGSIVVADDVCWRRVPGECLGNLACQPLRRRMLGNRKPQQLPPSVAENKKCEELLKGNRRNYKEINRRDPVSVLAVSYTHLTLPTKRIV